MFNYVKLAKKDVLGIVKATFPDWKGRKVKARAVEKVHITGLNWSGGSRSQYRSCTIDGRPLGSMDHHNQVAPWDQTAEGQSCPIPPGAVVVEHSIFCGKDSGLTIYVHPNDMPKFLPKP